MRTLIFIIAALTLLTPTASLAEETLPEGSISITIDVPGLDSSACLQFGWNWRNDDFGMLNGGLLGYLDSIQRKTALGLPWNAQLSILREVERVIRLESARIEHNLPIDATEEQIRDAWYHYDPVQAGIEEFDLPPDSTEEDIRSARWARWDQEAAERAAQLEADTIMLQEQYDLPYSDEAIVALELGLDPTSTAGEINHQFCLLEMKAWGKEFGLDNPESWQQVLDAAQQ